MKKLQMEVIDFSTVQLRGDEVEITSNPQAGVPTTRVTLSTTVPRAEEGELLAEFERFYQRLKNLQK